MGRGGALKIRAPFSILADVSDGAKILRGPWPGSRESVARARAAASEASDAGRVAPLSDGVAPGPSRPEDGAGRIHLGFVVRDCAVALGRRPTPEELAHWANHQCDERGEFCLFGREISPAEARVILAHPGREVTVRPERARPHSEPDPGSSSRSS
ncbi:MAG: hypothetical protein RL698_2161 [Pseudomonadota bacterium]